MTIPFQDFLEAVSRIPDPRRPQGKLYKLPHVLLFSILAVLSGANSYRSIHRYIEEHLKDLKSVFGLGWKKAPAYTSVRGILQGVDVGDLERVFRLHAAVLAENAATEGMRVVAFDGKTLRGSFDAFAERKARHLVSAFDTGSALVLGHLEVDDKSNEIPAVRRLLAELGLDGAVVTADAMHCQKNL